MREVLGDLGACFYEAAQAKEDPSKDVARLGRWLHDRLKHQVNERNRWAWARSNDEEKREQLDFYRPGR